MEALDGSELCHYPPLTHSCWSRGSSCCAATMSSNHQNLQPLTSNDVSNSSNAWSHVYSQSKANSSRRTKLPMYLSTNHKHTYIVSTVPFENKYLNRAVSLAISAELLGRDPCLRRLQTPRHPRNAETERSFDALRTPPTNEPTMGKSVKSQSFFVTKIPMMSDPAPRSAKTQMAMTASTAYAAESNKNTTCIVTRRSVEVCII